jgi:hypothetical protein
VPMLYEYNSGHYLSTQSSASGRAATFPYAWLTRLP